MQRHRPSLTVIMVLMILAATLFLSVVKLIVEPAMTAAEGEITEIEGRVLNINGKGMSSKTVYLLRSGIPIYSTATDLNGRFHFLVPTIIISKTAISVYAGRVWRYSSGEPFDACLIRGTNEILTFTEADMRNLLLGAEDFGPAGTKCP